MIKLDNVSKYYYSANAVVPALKKIQLEFNVGEFVAITGESGSGKTTLLNIISGLDTYDDGELYFNGKPTSHFDELDWEEYRKNKIGFVFANNNLIDNYTALQNVESSLLIQGINVHNAKQTAVELLDKVGMSNFAGQKAAQLSSGQRQRLAIARALAKNTDIIVADEATANLDSATGKQIVELLSKISKSKLIVLVTHNYEEVEPYVTRKIRIQDGQVELDIPVGHSPVEQGSIGQDSAEEVRINQEPDEPELPMLSTKENKKPVNSEGKIARHFALMNLTSEPKKSILLFTFMLFTAIVSFLLFGIISSNKDDINTKQYDKTVFENKDMNRIIARHPDGGEITKTDMQLFQSVKHVNVADMYDYANDINYYSQIDTDYKYSYNMGYTSKGALTEFRFPFFLNKNHFMKSETCINQDSLQEGRFPSKLFEIAVYSDNPDIIGTFLDCFFTADNIWGNKQHYYAKCEITGILKGNGDQIYFSGKLCSMLSACLSNNEYIVQYDSNGEGLGYKGKVSTIPVIGEGLEDNQIRITYEQVVTTSLHPIGKAELDVSLNDEYGAPYKTKKYDMEIISDYFNENNTGEFYEISQTLFNKLFSESSTQASLYIDDYVYMDNVLNELKDKGYDAISTYRTAAIKYIPEKVNARMSMICICIVVLVILCIFEILIVSSFLRIKSRYFLVLKSMGMNYKTAKKITYYELPVYALTASIMIFIFSMAECNIGSGYLFNLIKYFNTNSYILYFAYNIFLSVMTAVAFNRYLCHKMKRSIYDKN